MSETLKKGDRVIVTDLRTGKQHAGTIVGVPADLSQRVTVKYDSDGAVYRMSAGFVRKAT